MIQPREILGAGARTADAVIVIECVVPGPATGEVVGDICWERRRKRTHGYESDSKTGYANFRALTYVHAGQSEAALQELQKIVDSADSYGLPKEQSDSAKLTTLNNALLSPTKLR